MTSELQMKANTQNAQLSTGPLLLEGKQIVSRNAIKHGIFAKDLVINSGDGRENLQEYQELLSNLRKDLKPVGRMESIKEKSLPALAHLNRVIKYESSLEGSIFKNLAALKSLEQCRDSEWRQQED